MLNNKASPENLHAISEHIALAKADIVAGEKSFRSAAVHIAAAIDLGTTQVEVAKTIGKSQPWVNRLLKWHDGGFAEGGPFAEDNAKAKEANIISSTNNSPPDWISVVAELSRSACDCANRATWLQAELNPDDWKQLTQQLAEVEDSLERALGIVKALRKIPFELARAA